MLLTDVCVCVCGRYHDVPNRQYGNANYINAFLQGYLYVICENIKWRKSSIYVRLAQMIKIHNVRKQVENQSVKARIKTCPKYYDSQ